MAIEFVEIREHRISGSRCLDIIGIRALFD
jgi:hypothetical protein